MVLFLILIKFKKVMFALSRRIGSYIGRRTFSVESIRLPSLGESITEGSVGNWLKKKGDFIHEDEPVVSVETDKLGQEIRSTHSGELVEVMFTEGSEVKVGEVLFKIDTNTSK
jgi:2-oxoglutarate dehydrogenase E2 component (dihydrolipoamide succinyltransferase)